MGVVFSEDQKRVIESRGKNLLVSAAAGSGKTAVLVERILSLITDEQKKTDLDRILIVTFTVAAAGEMKERIGAALEQKLEEDPENEHLQHQAVLVHHAQINTIHSFCSYIIRNYFYRIDIDPVFRVMEEGERKLMFSDVLSDILEERYASEDPDFQFFVNNYIRSRTDTQLETVIEQLYQTAITTPWPEKWLADQKITQRGRVLCVKNQHKGDRSEPDLETDPLKLKEASEGISEEERQEQYCAPAVNALISVTEELIERYDAKKREKGVCDFSDLEHLALDILYEENENGEMVRTDAAKELAEHFVYVMTDEYQDSNLIQEAILTAVSGNEEGIFNRFMVGDIKQSIYGFRQARPDIFLQKYKTYAEDADCERIDLHTNYRSRREVIESVNSIFRRLMIPELGGIGYDDAAALVYGGQYPEEETPAARTTEVILMDKKSPDMNNISVSEARRIEAAAVAERIKKIVGVLPVYDKTAGGYRPCRYSDIAILFQVISGVADIFARVLFENGIPCHSVSKEGYFTATEVVTVLNYLTALDNPVQDIPFAALLFSPIGDLSAEEMAGIRAEKKELDYYHACLSYKENGSDESLREKLAAFLETFTALREQVPYTPVHELIRMIYKQTHYRDMVLAMPAGAQRAANLDMLITRARKFESTSYHGLFNFIRYIEKLKKYSMDEGEVNIFSDTADTVRLMTIHKSKGLEFPVVFLCDASHQFNTSDANGSFMFHPDLGIGLDVCDMEKHRIVKSIHRQRISDRKKEEIYAENLRVLYVALTRAREKLYITAVHPDLNKILTDCSELKLSPEEPLSKELILQYRRFADWLILTSYGVQNDFIQIHIETPTSVMDKLSRHDRRENSILSGLTAPDESVVYDEEIRRKMQEIRSFTYPKRIPEGLPGKVTVTQLKYLSEDMSEEEQGEIFEKEPVVIPYLPGFAAGESKQAITGAQRGTIYHKVFEKIDYAAIPDDSTEAAEAYAKQLLAELVRDGFLTEPEAEAVSLEIIGAFLVSSIGLRMKAAALKGDLKREQAFTFSIPANEAQSGWPEDEELLVQGIIDACFLEDGKYVIVDYKTDVTPDDSGASLVDKYSKQVYYYAKALEAATDVEVKEKLIYSTYLRKSIPCS